MKTHIKPIITFLLIISIIASGFYTIWILLGVFITMMSILLYGMLWDIFNDEDDDF